MSSTPDKPNVSLEESFRLTLHHSTPNLPRNKAVGLGRTQAGSSQELCLPGCLRRKQVTSFPSMACSATDPYHVARQTTSLIAETAPQTAEFFSSPLGHEPLTQDLISFPNPWDCYRQLLLAVDGTLENNRATALNDLQPFRNYLSQSAIHKYIVEGLIVDGKK